MSTELTLRDCLYATGIVAAICVILCIEVGGTNPIVYGSLLASLTLSLAAHTCSRYLRRKIVDSSYRRLLSSAELAYRKYDHRQDLKPMQQLALHDLRRSIWDLRREILLANPYDLTHIASELSRTTNILGFSLQQAMR